MTDRAVSIRGTDLVGTGVAEEVVTTGNEGSTNLTCATCEARECGTSLGKTR